jgi:hypothetical protein
MFDIPEKSSRFGLEITTPETSANRMCSDNVFVVGRR